MKFENRKPNLADEQTLVEHGPNLWEKGQCL